MQTVAAVCSSPGDFLRRRPSPVNRQPSFLPLSSLSRNFEGLVSKSDNKSSRFSRVVVASSADGFDAFETKGSSISSSSKDSLLMSLIQEIEPLDVSLIQKDVTNETIDAMKRTISGMLGLLPSDQFHVVVEAMWDPLFKLLVSSMMTGYTLRNAEYRLSFERNLDLSTEDSKKEEDSEDNKISREINTQNNSEVSRKDDFENKNDENNLNFEGLGEISEETRDYIIHLQSRLNYMKKELYDLKRKNSALQMQQFVGEEKNDLLDYLRSLKPEKVAELSEPTCAGVQEAIHSVAHGLLATLSPKMQSSKSPQNNNNNNNIINNNDNNNNNATLNLGKNDDDCTDLIEKISFKPQLFVPRDYLARLLFWCMLLGHYLRGLEYRLELTQLLTMGS